MKQHIDRKQLEELTQKQHERLMEWWWKRPPVEENGLETERGPRLSIGQMIEFLDEHGLVEIIQPIYENEDKHLWMVEDRYERFSSEYHQELCDSLWESVKECL